VTLSSASHAYANFDLVLVSGTEPDTSYAPGYASGNLLRAESNAAVYDRLTVTSPVQIDLVGHIGGENAYARASDSELYADELGSVSFGTGQAAAALIVTLSSVPPSSNFDLVVPNVNAPAGAAVPVDQALAGSAMLWAGEWEIKAQLRAEVRIGSVNHPTLAVQDWRSDFANTATFHLIADDPSAVTSRSTASRAPSGSPPTSVSCRRSGSRPAPATPATSPRPARATRAGSPSRLPTRSREAALR
jgi:hypothetical protein